MKKSTVRTIHEITIEEISGEIRFTYTGNGFLQNMIRIVTGTLVDVGTGVYPPEHVVEIMESKIRAEAGPTMPAQGLTLWKWYIDAYERRISIPPLQVRRALSGG